MKRQKGVTLIELLIAVAVIAILGSIAYPSYQEHFLKSHRSRAMTDLIKVQLKLEEQYTKNNSYLFNIVSGGSCSFCESAPDRYKFTIDSSGSGENLYIIKATPQRESGQNKDSCKTLTLNAAGIGKATGSGKCW
ncbi:type IV pilin protein [Photobacterium gaetbulicola]|uniref:Putative fimbrial assembly protein PilE n=1 Tax=Photobacterium gaetbulicola Gung47 TaxID=658445 RepID=A0A0C5X356_9GAMM|nr:type IV pilin protein [Photobacterium gaetbulicola]AJR09765.1 putative fimbrial assembly protein PilE [Photobacterium gaetbulicola Gung47]PSU12283.1 type IV pilin protein [Photobacterium gaetbulicola]